MSEEPITRNGLIRQFGLYPSEVQAARARADTIQDLAAALLLTPSGEIRGLTMALIEEAGLPAFATAVAAELGHHPVAALEGTIADALPDAREVLLTGAEAVGLAMRRSGVHVVFAYAGTSELAICDAMARLGLLVNGRGDRESLFQAGGANSLRPGNGAAVLHGARGLSNALGALADLRRNEIGTVAVVGLPSTASQPFLPPHGEPDLIPNAGAFAKSWYELSAIPQDAGGRDSAAAELFAAVQMATSDARRPPRGPVLLAVPQDVAEAAWVPLAGLPETGTVRPASVAAPGGAAATQSAAALLAAARRPVILVDDFALQHDGFWRALATFCRRTGAPALQVRYRRGPMLFERIDPAKVPGFLGWYDPATADHRQLLEAADLLITIEDRNMYPRVIGELPSCRKIAVTSKPAAARKNKYLRPGDVVLHGDVVAMLADLGDVMPDRNGASPWYARMVAAVQRPGLPVPAEAAVLRTGIAQAIRAAAGQPASQLVLVDDSQMFGGMLAEDYDSLPQGLKVVGSHGGFVGSGIAVATGLALGEPEVRVLCCLGDQGFTNGLQGLVCAVQESAPVTFLVCNNGGSVSLRKQSGPSGWLDGGCDRYLENAARMRYAEIAAALGLHSQRIDLSAWLDRDLVTPSLRALAPLLAAMADLAGPTLIELVLPADAEFWTGIWITAGFERAVTQESVGAARGGHA